MKIPGRPSSSISPPHSGARGVSKPKPALPVTIGSSGSFLVGCKKALFPSVLLPALWPGRWETFLLPGRISSGLKSAVGLTRNPTCVSRAHDRDERVPWEGGRCWEMCWGQSGGSGGSLGEFSPGGSGLAPVPAVHVLSHTHGSIDELSCAGCTPTAGRKRLVPQSQE